jgi:tRNA-binding EMAP/Myf-like protein
MGCDVHGFVEVRRPSGVDEHKWVAVLNIKHVIRRGYDSFGSLFGVRNGSGFTPYAHARGLPGDLSEAARAAYESREVDAHSMSYLTLEDVVLDVPWGEKSAPGSDRTRWSVLTDQWKWVLFEVMPWLGLEHGREQVRLVVWFTS